MRLYYSGKTKKYYVISDNLSVKILEKLNNVNKPVRASVIASALNLDKEKKVLFYFRLKKLNKLGLIEIIDKNGKKYVIPTFKQVGMLYYSSILSVIFLSIITSIVLYISQYIENQYKFLLLIAIILLIIYVVVFFKERQILLNIEYV